MSRIWAFATAILFAGSLIASNSISGDGVPVSVVVTAQGHHNNPAPQLTADDILVTQSHQHMPVTGIEPLAGQNLQLWVLIDDGASMSFGSQLRDLRKFVLAQRATAEIGVGYMRNGMVQVAQSLTADHELAAKSVRLPLGMPGASASPYLSLVELIHKWPSAAATREVLMVTSGIDPIYGSGPDNPYLLQAISTAQRAGVVVYSVYYSGAGRASRAGRQLFWGQNYLSQLGDETGGYFYWIGAQNPVSLIPYLDDFDHRLDNQYLVTFLARPEDKPGFQNVKISTEKPNVSLAAPGKVYVPVSK